LYISQTGKGTLSIAFTGELNEKMKGFYRSRYSGPDGEDRFGAVTQFEVRSIKVTSRQNKKGT